MSSLQQNEHEAIVKLMGDLGLDYRPASMDIPRESLEQSIMGLAAYVRRRDMWYSVIDQQPISRSWVKQTCDRLFDVIS